MVKVLNPLGSTEARGAYGGTVYNTCRGVTYAKQNRAPANPMSTRQLKIRSILSDESRAWQGLTSVQRAAWEVYAAANKPVDWTGKSLHLSGLNWFVKCNCLLKDIGISTIASPPATPGPTAPTGIALSKATTDLKLAWTAPVAATLYLDAYILGPISPGVAGRIERAKHQYYGLASVTSPVVLVAGAAVGTWVTWVRVIDSVTGLTSQWVKYTFAFT